VAVSAALAAACVIAASSSTVAHVTLETKSAPAGSYYKAVFRVSHGCEKSPTTAIRIMIPASVERVKPMPKFGWRIAVAKAEHTSAASGHHHAGKEVIASVLWSGGSLPDSQFDEFVMMLKLPEMPGKTLHFPVLQSCEAGELRWIEILDPSTPAGHHRRPAPALRLEDRK